MYEYGAGQYLIASVDLPVMGYFTDAVPSRPALGFGMTLEPAVIAELLLLANTGQGAVELVAGGDVKLGEDLVQVVFDGARAHEQPSGDLGVGHAVAGQPADLGWALSLAAPPPS